jgi:formyl-CoA transferase
LGLVGRPAILSDPIYRDRKTRIELFDLLTEIIAGLLATRSAHEFLESAQAAGLPCALTQTAAEFVHADQPRARGSFVRSSRSGTGIFDMPGAPFASSPPLISYRTSAPTLGEANEDVYVRELGHKIADLERWRSNGLV